MTNVAKGTKGFLIISPEKRFWEKVDKSNGETSCWIWLGATDGRYGQFWVDGRIVRASRFSWSIHNGIEFPKDKEACHKCDNTMCVNPSHIWPGTHKENLLDASSKGRLTSKERNPRVRKTHCKRGHEFNEENTKIRPDGMECLACKRMHNANKEYSRRYRSRKADELEAGK